MDVDLLVAVFALKNVQFVTQFLPTFSPIALIPFQFLIMFSLQR